MTDLVLERLASMVGPGVGLGVETVEGVAGLTPLEAIAIERAVPRRAAEFAAGRRAARTALEAIGLERASLPVGPDRAPVWPEGATGSITHDRDLALAAAVSLSTASSIGIDLTEAAPLPDGVRERILRHRHEEHLTDMEARAAFSAKESLFKALAPHVGFVFGFSAAVVHVDLERETFDAHLVQPLGPFAMGQTWEGQIAIEGDRLITALLFV
ncbi:MAG: 4'-phosphopantetheinyl transferase superfamily protein [Rhodobacteraceae bacterium]|nr:MAG: 4'-phosphopantetheinyl transferase superfamily protein [Paracoccaceae bacterium]